MTEFSLPWPETSGPQVGDGREYTAAEWDQVWEALFTAMSGASEGVLVGAWKTLEVTAPAANTIRVNTGIAVVKGHVYWNTASLDLTPNNAGTTRKDSVVLECDWVDAGVGQYTVRLLAKEGTSGDYPSMTQTDDSLWQLELFRYVIDSSGAITGVTDVRAYCHFATMVDVDMLDAAIAGTGLSGGAGSALSVNASDLAGDNLVEDGGQLSVSGGAGSGLDADTVDGSEASAFAAASHAHAATEITSGKLANARLNTGTGNGLDADTVDGYEAATLLGGGLPVGAIVLWYGSLASIPSGYTLCDGSSGTPDLTDKFVVGAGDAYAPAATGGEDSRDMAHTHGTNFSTDTEPDHGHGLSWSNTLAQSGTGATTATGLYDDGGHNHTIYAPTQSAQSTVDNRPQYYALAYIMRVS